MIPVSTACLTHMHCLTEACNGLQVLKLELFLSFWVQHGLTVKVLTCQVEGPRF